MASLGVAEGMDWGIDPERVAEVAEIIRNRKLPAADAEKVVLAIVGGGGENVDQPLWDMAQILFCLGHLARQPRLGPRDAATACLARRDGRDDRPAQARAEDRRGRRLQDHRRTGGVAVHSAEGSEASPGGA